MINNSSIVAFSIFLVSLQSYYFYSVGAPLFSIFGVFFLLVISLYTEKSFLSRLGIITILLFLFYPLVLIWSLLTVFLHVDEISAKRLISFIIMISSAFAASYVINNYNVKSMIKPYLFYHSMFLIIQLLMFYIFHINIDFIEPITGETQRTIGSSFQLPIIGSFIRPSGLFNEPGTFATYYAPVLALFSKWNLNEKNDKYYLLMGLLCLIATFSVYAIIFALLIILTSRMFTLRHKLFLLSVLTVITSSFLTYRFIQRTTLGLNSGLEFRITYFNRFIEFLANDLISLIFGHGILASESKIIIDNPINDVGLIFYLLFYLGPIISLLIISLLIYISFKRGVPSLVCIVIILLSKISIFSPIFIFFIAFALQDPSKYIRISSILATTSSRDKALVCNTPR